MEGALAATEDGDSSRDIHELNRAVSKLSSKKANERKNANAGIRRLLSHQCLLSAIDESSKAKGKHKGGSRVSWNQLLQVSRNHFFEQGKTSSSYKEAFLLFKAVLRAGNRNGPEISVKGVVEHLLSLLHNVVPAGQGEGRDSVVLECSGILVGEVLVHRSYRNTLGHYGGFSDLLTCYLDLYLTSPSNHSLSLLSVISQLLGEGHRHGDLPVASLYIFIKDHIVPDIKTERNSKVVQTQLAVVNTFALACARSSRGRLAKLGRLLAPTLIALWSKSQLPLKKEITTFLRLQVSIHFCGGRVAQPSVDQTASITAENREAFLRSVQLFNQVLLGDIKGSIFRLSWKSKGEPLVFSELISLMADSIRLVNVLELSSSDGAEDNPPPGKKPKHCSGWGLFAEEIPANISNPSVTVWLQVLYRVLTKWGRDFPLDEVLPLLTLLHQVQKEGKRVDVISSSVKCLAALATSSEVKWDKTHSEVWAQVWSTTLRLLSVHSCEEDGFHLLSTLLPHKAISLECSLHDVWPLFMPGFSKCKRWHVAFLAQFLSSPVVSEGGSQGDGKTQIALRSQLIAFLLHCPSAQDLCEGPLSSSAAADFLIDRPHPHNMAAVLVSLTQRSSALVQLHSPVPRATWSTETTEEEDLDSRLHGIEQSFLADSFEIPFEVRSFKVAPETNSMPHLEKPLASLEDSLLSALELAAASLQSDCVEDTSDEMVKGYGVKGQIDGVHVLLRLQISCAATVLSSLAALRACGGGGARSDSRSLQTLLQSLLKEVEKGMRSQVWMETDSSSRHALMTNVIHDLVALVTPVHLHGNITQVKQVHQELLTSVFPHSIVGLVGAAATEKWFCSAGSHGNSIPNWVTSAKSRADCIELDHHRLPPRLPVVPALPEGAGQGGYHQADSTRDILSPLSLDDGGRLALAAVDLLVDWVRTLVVNGNNPRLHDGLSGCVNHVLLSVLSPESSPSKLPRGVQVVLKCCTLEPEGLPGEYGQLLLERIRDLLVAHPWDPSVAGECLVHLRCLSPLLHRHHLRSSPEPGSLGQLYSNLMQVFRKLQVEGRLPPAVRIRMLEGTSSLLEGTSSLLEGTSSLLEGTSSLLAAHEGEGAGGERIGAEVLSDDDNVFGEVTVREVFLSFLADKDHSVRRAAAGLVSVLFTGNAHQDQDTFAAVNQVLALSTARQSVFVNLDEDSQSDESFVLMSSCLATFQTVACISPECERIVLMTVFRALGAGHVGVALVRKMLMSMMSYLGYRSSGPFLSRHMTSLVTNWLENRCDIASFPWQLFEGKSLKDFFVEFSKDIVPCLVWSCDQTALARLGEICGTSLINLVRNCLPKCLLVVMTTYALQTDKQEVSESAVSQATAVHDLLVGFFGEKGLSDESLRSMPAFVVALLSCVHEEATTRSESEYSGYFRASDPEPDFPHYTTRQVRRTLSYMRHCYGTSTSLVTNIARTKDGVQSVLLSLLLLMDRAHHSSTRTRLLVGYAIFVRLVLEDLPSGLNGTAPYVIHSVVCSLLHLSRQAPQLCCDLLLDVVRQVFAVLPEELGGHLPRLFSALLPLAHSAQRGSGSALALLDRLLADYSGEEWGSHWAATCRAVPAPTAAPAARALMDRLQQLQGSMGAEEEEGLSLEETVRAFARRDPSDYPITLGEVVHVRTALTAHRLRPRPHTPDPAHYQSYVALVRQLVTLCKGCHGDGGSGVQGNLGDLHDDVLTECGRCLGELGVVNLGTSALPTLEDPAEDLLKSLQMKSCEVHTFKVLRLAAQLISDTDVEVVSVCSASLKAILSTSQGEALLAKVLRLPSSPCLLWTRLLEPFRAMKNKKQPTSPSPSSSSFFCKDSIAAQSRVEAAESIFSSAVWYPWQHSPETTYSKWLQELTVTLLRSGCVQDPVLMELPQLCMVKLQVAELVLPFAVHNALVCSGDLEKQQLSRCFREFFDHASSPSPSNQLAIEAVIGVVLYLRTVPFSNKSRGPSTAWSSNFWLELDYLAASRAALRSSLPLTSLLCLEIHAGQWGSSAAGTTPSAVAVGDSSGCTEEWGEDSGCLETTSPYLRLGSHASGVHAQLVELYSRLGEADCLDGVYTVFGGSKNVEGNKLRLYEHEGNWLGSLGGHVHDLGEGPLATASVKKALHGLGWHKLNRLLSLPPAQAQDSAGREFDLEAVWRTTQWTEDWDLPLVCCHDNNTSFSQHICSALAALGSHDDRLIKQAVHRGRLAVLSSLRVGSETGSALPLLLGQLQCWREVEEVGALLSREEAGGVAGGVASSSPTEAVLGRWQRRLPPLDPAPPEFSCLEPVLALRCTLLRYLLTPGGRGRLEEGGGASPTSSALFAALRASLVQRTVRARTAGRFQVSEAAVHSLRSLRSPPRGVGEQEEERRQTEWLCGLHRAQLHWARQERSFALHTLASLSTDLLSKVDDSSLAAALYPSVLCLHGNWLAEMRAESPNVILKKYLLKAVEYITDGDAPLSSGRGLEGCVLPEGRAYITLARYADGQYQLLVRRMASPGFQAKKALCRKSKEEAEEVSKMASQKSDYARMLRQLNKHREQDQAELVRVLKDKAFFLRTALKNYLLTLKTSDASNLCVFRLCSLWFDSQGDDAISHMIKAEGVESRKFLPLLYQLAARVSEHSKESAFQQALRKVILKVCRDHPQHSLYVLLAMKNAPRDQDYPSRGFQCGSGSGSGRAPRRGSTAASTAAAPSIDMDKVLAASSLLQQLASSFPELVLSVEQLCLGYIELAYHDTSSKTAGRGKTGVFPLPTSSVLSKIGQLKTVVVPTIDMPIDPSCCYDNLTYIEGFDESFRVETGVNAPKVVSCIGSDGVRRRQLIKVRDDLRQDGVMQQVFSLVNRLLRRDLQAAQRKLTIRTYKVIPLSQRSGVVEWCEGTVPLGMYLIGQGVGAHQRYCPLQWSNSICRKKMEEVASRSKDQKTKVFKLVMENFKPVLRHFFLERFSSPVTWFERRHAYTRSVATSSIVGYILGLGDRHVQNILIDNHSAEVIHIDLGVAFEQGRTLPTPETIPFRLTRDLIDGMGLAGAEGLFRRACEVTLNTMKDSREEVRTIVEVLLHDPLYMWTLKTGQIQPSCKEDADLLATYASGDILAELDSLAATQREGSVSKMADRALLRLQEKLDGYEEGVSLSTSGHINVLIQMATSIENLSCLFPGWQPWI
nr:ATM kinase [Halisarca dujardinii]